MKYLIFLFPFLSLAQVGIGTTDPQAMLDINGDLIVRDVQQMATDKTLVWNSATGKVGYGTANSGISAFQGVTQVASAPVDYVAGAGQEIVNVPLGLVASVTVAPNSINILKISYYVPAGIITTNTEARGYIGATFFKDGNEIDYVNSKFAILAINTGTGTNGFEMGYLTNTYIETITNNTNVAVTHSYEVQGYLEQYYIAGATATYRFNMWAANGNNYNWGKANLQYQLIRF